MEYLIYCYDLDGRSGWYDADSGTSTTPDDAVVFATREAARERAEFLETRYHETFVMERVS